MSDSILMQRISKRFEGGRSLLVSDFRDDVVKLVQQIFLAQQPPHVVIFAGVDPGSGCSEVCASVAEMLASHAQRSVCLVDANLRSPSLARIFELSDKTGLADSLRSSGSVRSFASQIGPENLWLLPAGSLNKDSAAMLNTSRLSERLVELRQEFDFVIVDAPPIGRYSDAVAVSQDSEGVIMVLECGVTHKESALAAAAKLRSAGVPLLSAVLNRRTYPIPESIYRRL
jgi:capsular exopolysaccharide synthesis family protein